MAGVVAAKATRIQQYGQIRFLCFFPTVSCAMDCEDDKAEKGFQV